jgi:hypothetical protein
MIDRRDPIVDFDGLRRAALVNQTKEVRSDRHEELERSIREIAESAPRNMVEAVERASIEEVPEAARTVSLQITEAIDRVAADADELGMIMHGAAQGLRAETERVCRDIRNLMFQARRIHELNRSTRAAYAEVPKMDLQ